MGLGHISTVTLEEQTKWLEADLEKASRPESRKIRPWIVAFAHRPPWCSHTWECCSGTIHEKLQTYMEPLFLDYGVNLGLFGHIHAIERTTPIGENGTVAGTYSEPKGTVYLTQGASGQAFLGDFQETQPPWSAWRTPYTYGFSRLYADKSKLTIETISMDKVFLDTFTITGVFKGRKYGD